jgi:hypothetical protein
MGAARTGTPQSRSRIDRLAPRVECFRVFYVKAHELAKRSRYNSPVISPNKDY